MKKRRQSRVELLQGTLDMLVLRALLFGPLHGHAIATHIQRTSEECSESITVPCTRPSIVFTSQA